MVAIPSVFGQKDTTSISEKRVYTKQFELRHDNDFLHFTDQYYSTGSFLGLRSLIEPGKDTLQKKHFGFYLFQEIYTPSNITETNTLYFDRPYAGILGFLTEYSLANQKRFLEYRLAMGFTGQMSGAEGLQSLFHTAVATDSQSSTWNDQIAMSLHANLYVNYAYEIKFQPNPFSVHFAINPSLGFGTRDMYLEQDAVFYFGKRSPITETTAYKQLGTTGERELFFAIRLGYRYVFHDAMLEGNLFNDRSTFTVTPYNQLFLYNFELYYRKGRNDIKFTYNFETPRNRAAEPHLYMTLTLARSY
ncbi:lipid A deacylase LpxR family protein [Aureisphaera sp. CAU 1614]|uniref:Lipid A deacylase LpxR family protein n=1 Tax=Halomarinibacterium sedimenti TaxID=2857106 RepID=A0A9X1JWC2_9FLAO|nr:lipid A-modifier LpxR family protein [Halomarinibacterium sedimenti]MBW2936888.1 lipid A deacylase LpxR family protein [Halomarinibacterium sedimenti]